MWGTEDRQNGWKRERVLKKNHTGWDVSCVSPGSIQSPVGWCQEKVNATARKPQPTALSFPSTGFRTAAVAGNWEQRSHRGEPQGKEEVLENTFKFSLSPCLTPKPHTLRQTGLSKGKNTWKAEGTEPRLQLVPRRKGKNLDLILTSLEGYRKNVRLPQDTEKDQELR